MLLTVVARLHIDAILAMIINFNNIYIDFWVQIFISVILVLKSGWIYQIVEKFDKEVYSLTRYIINNFTEDNYRRWKRNITFVICSYLLIYLSFVEINSNILRIYILQYMICYMMIEVIERKYYDGVFHIFNTKTAVFTYKDDCEIIEDKQSTTRGIQFSDAVKKASSNEHISSENNDQIKSSKEESFIIKPSSLSMENYRVQIIDDHIQKEDTETSNPTVKKPPSVISFQSITAVQPIKTASQSKFILSDNFVLNTDKMKQL